MKWNKTITLLSILAFFVFIKESEKCFRKGFSTAWEYLSENESILLFSQSEKDSLKTLLTRSSAINLSLQAHQNSDN